ncbi:hypothetical protein MKEN_00674100 [Mycena kentingensis (nom. inval.)]|nr:hypothetical protein MKEN_00674100 [Mycena kentingensis (nom. inval.)]
MVSSKRHPSLAHNNNHSPPPPHSTTPQTRPRHFVQTQWALPPPMMRSASATSTDFAVPTNTPTRAPSFGPQTPQRQASLPRSASPVKREQMTPAPSTSAMPIPGPTAIPAPQPGPSASIPGTKPWDRIIAVPLATSLTSIPALSAEEIAQVKEWRQKDQVYTTIAQQQNHHMIAERQEVFGPRGLPWWERGSASSNQSRFITGREKFEIKYPYVKGKREGRRKPKREGIKLPNKLPDEQVNRPEELVPIRLEFDVDQQKVRDTFMWDMNACAILPEDFAQSMVEDYNLPSQYHSVIVKSIQDQLSDYRAHSTNYDGDNFVERERDSLQAGKLDEEGAAFWENWRNRLRREFVLARAERTKGRKRRKILADDDTIEPPKDVEEFSLNMKTMRQDTRIVIRLDITVGSVKLDDQFEWDLDNDEASPEAFAELHAQELGLGGEFKTAIAHSIREQIHAYQKTVFLLGSQDEDLRNSVLPPLSTGARTLDQVQAFTPLLNYLSDGELERNEKERDKEMNKRKKRGRGGRRAVVVPDREPIRTCRTPAIGFPEPDPAAVAAVAVVTAAPTRRAAAAAASLTIASLVASENGGPVNFTPSSVPSLPAPAPLVFKEKAVKGFFKPPPYSPSLLLPRARATPSVPPSTAVDVSTLPAPLENDPPPRPATRPAVPRAFTAKQKKDAEREAKEKEFAEGQRPNIINGVWHCSNCGCPESIAVGRRKGPLGEKSQCGTCGKYWHRYRKPRPIEYNSSYEYHSAQQRNGEARPRRGRPPNVPSTPMDTSEPQTPRDVSPVSTASSASEMPLAQRMKKPASTMNGAGSSTPAPISAGPPPSSGPPSSLPPKPSQPPQWLLKCMQELQSEYKNDKFEVICKANATEWEWRVKCLDCPGKVYITGPGETLTNYELHLKNRQHRTRVTERMRNASG